MREGDVDDQEFEEDVNEIYEMVEYDLVEITDIAEEKGKIEVQTLKTKGKEKMEEMDPTYNETEKVIGKQYVLVHSASFYGLMGSGESKVDKTMEEEEVKQDMGSVGWGEGGENGDEGEDNPEANKLGLMVRTDTRECLIAPADWCVTPR